MKIGKITSINYSQLRVKISSEIRGGSVNIQGEIYYFGNIGSYLKVVNSVEENVICEVVSIFDSDLHKERHSFDVESDRELLLKPIGTIDKDDQFTLGVGIFPSLYSDVSIVTFDDMELILGVEKELLSQDKPDNNDGIHKSFTFGFSKNLINYPINLSIDNFFNIHSAVLGNSGSGKSNTIAHIIQDIHKKRNNTAKGSKMLLFDVNGEYQRAFKDYADDEIVVKCYKPNVGANDDTYLPFFLPHFLLTLDEWSAFLMATDATQRPFWDKVLQESYRFYQIGNSSNSDKFIEYLRYRMCSMIYSTLQQADSDTTRVTTIAGILGSIRRIIESDQILKGAAEQEGLLKNVMDLQQVCTLHYGKNNDEVEKKTKEISDKIDNSVIQKVLSEKLRGGEYFSHEFLKIATDITLLEEEARGNRQIRGYVSTMLIRLDYFLDNPNCNFMREKTETRNTYRYLSELWSSADKSKAQLVIIDTSELQPDILETVTSVVSRLLFDERRDQVGDRRRENPVHLILDEAHRYIKKDYDYLLKENIFEKIAREGRKYSIYLLLSSQRPSELSETVLSQCANFVIHRIQNEKDMRYIQAILPYFSEDFTNKIKQSIPGEALVFGNCVSMPLHIKVNKADPAPNSDNCNIPEEWFKMPPDE